MHDGDASLGCIFSVGDGIWVGDTDTGFHSAMLKSDEPPVCWWGLGEALPQQLSVWEETTPAPCSCLVVLRAIKVIGCFATD